MGSLFLLIIYFKQLNFQWIPNVALWRLAYPRAATKCWSDIFTPNMRKNSQLLIVLLESTGYPALSAVFWRFYYLYRSGLYTYTRPAPCTILCAKIGHFDLELFKQIFWILFMDIVGYHKVKYRYLVNS